MSHKATPPVAARLRAAERFFSAPIYDIMGEILPIIPLDSTTTKNLIREEALRINGAGITDWAGYRGLSRAGSSIALGGRQKRALYNALKAHGWV